MSLLSPSFLWPQGKTCACSFSWDDGRDHDRRVVALHNTHGVKGTFHLNSGALDRPRYLNRSEIAALFAGHEISLHSVTHPFPTRIASAAWMQEVMQDKAALEEIAGTPIRSASWPFGDFDRDTQDVLRLAGISCCRSTRTHSSLALPSDEDWLRFATSCHFTVESLTLWRSLIAKPNRVGWFSVWSHSFEIEDRNEWDALDALCRELGAHPACWHATVIEVHDYLSAWRGLGWSVSKRQVWNPSHLHVWARVGEEMRCIPPGVSEA